MKKLEKMKANENKKTEVQPEYEEKNVPYAFLKMPKSLKFFI